MQMRLPWAIAGLIVAGAAAWGLRNSPQLRNRLRELMTSVRVRVSSPAQPVEWAVGRWGDVTPLGDDACLLEMNVDSLEWPVMVLANLEADFEVEGPQELKDLVRGTAERFGRAASG